MKIAAIVLSLLVSLALFAPAVSTVHAGNLEIDFIVVEYPSLEYADFVGIFNSILIEELKKTEGQGFATARWRLLISPVPPSNKKVKIDVARGGMKESALVAVLSENASFVSIQAVVEHVIETLQRGGVK